MGVKAAINILVKKYKNCFTIKNDLQVAGLLWHYSGTLYYGKL